MDNAKRMRSAYERINARDLPGFAALLAEDFVEHEEVPGIAPTKAGVLEYFSFLQTAFPDMQMNVEDIIAGGDKTVARVTVSGTHEGAFMGVPPTGKRIEMKLIDIMQFDGEGLVCAHWGVADMLTMMQQLGVVPAGPPA